MKVEEGRKGTKEGDRRLGENGESSEGESETGKGSISSAQSDGERGLRSLGLVGLFLRSSRYNSRR